MIKKYNYLLSVAELRNIVKNKSSKNNDQNDGDGNELITPIVGVPTPTPNAEKLDTKLILISNFSKSQNMTPTLDELTLKSIFEKQIIESAWVEV